MATATATPAPVETIALNLSMIDAQSFENARKRIDTQSDDWKAFLATIKKHGVMSPVQIVRSEKGKFRIFAGFRRLLAATELKLQTIPARIFAADGTSEEGQIDMEEKSLVENLQREDLHWTEIAPKVVKLLAACKESAKQTTVGAAVGLFQVDVSNYSNLAGAPFFATALDRHVKGKKVVPYRASVQLLKEYKAAKLSDADMVTKFVAACEATPAERSTSTPESDTPAGKGLVGRKKVDAQLKIARALKKQRNLTKEEQSAYDTLRWVAKVKTAPAPFAILEEDEDDSDE